MLKAIDDFVREFLAFVKESGKPVRLISHFDSDGITSASILVKTMKRLDLKFSLRIVKSLDKEVLSQELERGKKEILFFSDLASGSLDYFSNVENKLFILDHHEIDKEKLESMKDKVRIINPHLFNEEVICGAGLCYLFSKSVSKENKDLANLAIIGMIGDRLDSNISKINQQIVKDASELKVKKGLLIFSATRPLRKSLEYSTSTYIPGVTGSSSGVSELLREINISPMKSLYDLNDEEMSRLVTAVMVRRAQHKGGKDIIGNIYMMKFFNHVEDVRELSVLINACSRLGNSDIAVSFCLENEKAKSQAEDIYVQYRQKLMHALRFAEEMEKSKGNGFIILNARDEIEDSIIGTVMSILSSSINYESGTVMIGMAYNGTKIKISARIVGDDGRNLKEVLEKSVVPFEDVEIGGHEKAAGCLIKKEDEEKFLDSLKKTLEIEVVRV